MEDKGLSGNKRIYVLLEDFTFDVKVMYEVSLLVFFENFGLEVDFI